MYKRGFQWLCFQFLFSGFLFAQDERAFLESRVSILASAEMKGRGYVDNGVERAAAYLNTEFQKAGLKPLPESHNSFFQNYSFPVNRFPGAMLLSLDKKQLRAGTDFMVHPSSLPAHFDRKKVRVIDVSGIRDSISWRKFSKRFRPDRVYMLKGIDTIMRYGSFTIRSVARLFPAGFYLLPMHSKLTWLASSEKIPGTIIFLEDSVLPKKLYRLSVSIDAEFIPDFPSVNLAGYIRGTAEPDSFIVLTAHFDHLGEMGKNIVFPGANDNASGVAMLLLFANYFSAHPARYSIAFLAFSGEEVRLMGSSYYASHPLFPLAAIRFLINIDMAADATKGLTAVNATVFDKEFELLRKINQRNQFLPAILSRGPTRNSDHFPFYEKQVPCFFIYSNGVKPYYHDLKDSLSEISFEHAEGIVRLLKAFVLVLSGDCRVE